jgi:nicotinamidase-related amidase
VLNPIMAKSTAIIVVDLQWEFLDKSSPFCVEGGDVIVKNGSLFISSAREQGCHIVYTAAYLRPGVPSGKTTRKFAYKEAHRDTWARLGDGVVPIENDVVIHKPRQSAFFGTDLDSVLRTFEVETVAILGVTANVCCLATAIDAAARDYDVLLVDGLLGALPLSRGEKSFTGSEVTEMVLAFAQYSIGRVARPEEILAALK